MGKSCRKQRKEQLLPQAAVATPLPPLPPGSPPSREIWDWLVHPEGNFASDLPWVINTLWMRDGERWEDWEKQHNPASVRDLTMVVLGYLAADMGGMPSSDSFQQLLSYTMQSDLALALIDGTVFEIAHGLLDIQHLTEKNLYNQRQKLHGLKQELVRKHKEALQSCKTHKKSVLRAAQQRELEALELRVKDEQRMMDEKIVLELDQKVVDQQNTLEKAGVPGFYITTDPQDI
ncbi:UNVERIFIED_CONTAM: hypothetical protein FKN15_069026 [Acipenser sinensis]